jgi:4-coumarate--CoA ligase
MTFVADRVSPHKKIRLVEFIDDIPKTPTGKILRRELIARGETNGTTAPTEAAGSEQF